MKIAQIVCVYPPYPGGIGQSAKRFGEILALDNEVITFTLLPQAEFIQTRDDVKYLNPLLRHGHGGMPFSLLFSLRKFDCIYLHYPFFGAAEIVWAVFIV